MKQARDLVCGMMVDIDKAAFRTTHQGIDYYFCASECRKTFEANPAKFVAAPDRPQTSEPPHTKAAGMVSPKFGSAGSGGAEYEPGPRAGKASR
jgi:Cu+-exporting ATPase